MFYYLINNSSILNNQNEASSNIKLVLYGSIIYIVIHAFLSFSKNNILKKIKIYFWFMLILDVILTYMTKQKKSTIGKDGSNNKDSNFVKDLFDLKSNLQNILKINKNDNNDNNDNIETDNNTSKELEELHELKEKINNNLSSTNKTLEPPENNQVLKDNNTKYKIKKENTNNNSNILTINNNDNNNDNNDNNEKETSSKKTFSTPLNKIINKKTITNTNKINKKQKKESQDDVKETGEQLFNDNSSLSGSEIDFDIAEFENTLE